MRVLELYSGIGGMHFALSESTIAGSVVMSADINTVANEVYKFNFPETINNSRNIESFTIEELLKLNIDCILMSPPCQPFTRVGLKKDSKDNRCSSLLHILNIIPHIKTLKYILLENVKGFECSEARNEVLCCLEKLNFNFKELILSPCQFGIPNSRHRYYLLAKSKDLKFIFKNSDLITSIPNELLQILPKKSYDSFPFKDKIVNSCNNTHECFKLEHILEENVDSKYLIPEDILLKRNKLLDIRCRESKGSCCFTKAYSRYSEGTGSVLSLKSESETKEKFQEFNNSKESKNSINNDLLDLKLRYFTPKEISRLMCFPENLKFPHNLTTKQMYRLLGNSINVFVVSQLIYLLHYDNCI